MTRVVNIAQSGGNNVTMRNRIINGAMMIDQRNGGASVNANSSSAPYITDRFNVNVGGSSAVIACQQVSDAPAGFVNSLKLTVSTTSTPSSGQFLFLRQIIEGFNIADLAWGTASAQPVTISFWVKASVTGTYSAFTVNSAEDRSYVATFTVSSSSTWEYKTVTIPGDTTGTWLTNNSNGIRFGFDLGSGSNFNGTANTWQTGWKQRTSGTVSLVGNAGATFQVTGVQLEAGTTATPFEQRLYGTELALCQRYFSSVNTGILGVASTSSGIVFTYKLPMTMRTTPSITLNGTTQRVGDMVAQGHTITGASVTLGYASANQLSFTLNGTPSPTYTTYRTYLLEPVSGSDSYVWFSAEL